MTAPLILASGSPRRSQLLAKLPIHFEVCNVAVDEGGPVGGRSAAGLAQELARTKALAAAGLHPQAAVLAADTIVVLDDTVLGKPATVAIARENLRRMSGRRLAVVTATAVVQGGRVTEETVSTALQMNPISDAAITSYLQTGAATDKAGGLEIQGRARPFVAEIDGCWTNVVGLPLCAAARLLGVTYPQGACTEP